MYGVRMCDQEAPLVFLLSKSEQLAAYIRDDPLGPFAGELQWPDYLFSEERPNFRESDAPVAPGRWMDYSFQLSEKEPFLLKADWHSVHDWGTTFDIFVPRRGAMAPCQMAPPRLLAFMEAFREVNCGCWQAITHGLRNLKAKRENDFDRQRLLGLLLESMDESGYFGAVEAQAGPALEKKKMNWHRDGATGLLHLSITLSGTRKVMFRATTQEMREVYMVEGSFYLSSPFLFNHGVQYYKAQDNIGPVITLMCRFGYLDGKDAQWANEILGPDMLEVTELIAACLRDETDKGNLRLPTLQEVTDLEARHLA